MMQDGVAELLSFLFPSFVKLVFLLMRSAFSLQVSATVVLCHVKLMSGVLSLEVREQMLCRLVFCCCVQPSVCRSLRQWFFAMSHS